MAGPADPFQTVSGAVPANGLGPNVLLQDNPLVAFHPPLLYLGFVGFTVPFAFAVASLATGRVDEDWQIATRRWTLARLGVPHRGHRPRRLVVVPGARLGRLLGVGPGRERLVPALAVRHRLPALGARPGAARAVARLEPVAGHRHLQPHHPRHVPHPVGGGGVGARLQRPPTSVPSCSASSAWCSLGGVGLIAWRGDRLRSPGGIDSPVSREGAFLLNNLLFAAFAFVVLLGHRLPPALRGLLAASR